MSKTYQLQLIDDSNYNILLEKASFDSLDVPESVLDGIKFKLKTKDSYKILKLTNEKVEFEFKREKFFEPAGLFKIEIVLTVGYKLKKSKNKEREKIIKEDIKNKYRNLFSPAATRASILVSALTNVNWKEPVVDPPYPLFKDDKD